MLTVEHALVIGDIASGRHLLFVLPLFEEGNRSRRTIVMAMRSLAAKGFVCHLPELPGQYDHSLPTEAASLSLWRQALADYAAALPAPVVVSIRGGCLIDDSVKARGWWRLAPVAGAKLLRTMVRAAVVSQRESGEAIAYEALYNKALTHGALLAGNYCSQQMIAQLDNATPLMIEPSVTLNLGPEAHQINVNPLWNRAEPGEDADFAATIDDNIANTIANWDASCAAS